MDYSPDFLRSLLTRSKVIAMVGASTESWRPSFRIMAYLQRSGYRVLPVNPFELGKSVHGEQFYASLSALNQPIDLVNVFRRADAIDELVDEAISVRAPALWLQLGVVNVAARDRAEAAGIPTVMDRCISVEHSRLVRGA